MTAFTLLELLVALAILVVLIGLVLPALQVARSTAARLRCGNHLRQVGLALHQHHDAHRLFPSNGGWDGRQTIRSTDGRPFTPSTTDDANGITYSWGVGQPNLAPPWQTGSWLYALLPYAEQDNVHRQRDWSAAVPLYICPARRSPDPQPVAASDAHGTYVGGGHRWAKTDYACNDLMIPNRLPTGARCRAFASVTDGTSQTILAGEKAFDPQVQTPASWKWDEPYFLGGSRGTSRNGLLILKDAPDIRYKFNWGSAHHGGAQFVFADGSVRPLTYAKDWAGLAALLSPAGQEVVPDP